MTIVRLLFRGLKICFFRPMLPGSFYVTFGQLVTILALHCAVQAGVSALRAENHAYVQFSGLNYFVAGWVLIAVVLAVLKTSGRYFDIREMLAALAIADIWLNLAGALVGSFSPDMATLADGKNMSLFWAVYAAIWLIFLWSLAAAFWAGRQLSQFGVKRFGMRTLAASLAPMFLLPQDQLFYSSTPSLFQSANVWYHVEYWARTYAYQKADNTPRPAPIDFEAVLDRQPEMVAAAVAKIDPGLNKTSDLFFVGMASFGDQAVFMREIKATRTLFDERFKTAGRSIALNNHRDTIDDMPLASATNLGRALSGVASRMDKENDILVLFLTSHGGKEVLSVDFDSAPFQSLTAETLAKTLDQTGIKNRVVIISACHSGSFIPALKNDNTLVITAASAEKVSFGCSNERDWTYFSDALVNHALRSTYSLVDAFGQASTLIKDWEKRDGLIPSEPQISLGKDIAPKLAALAGRLAEQSESVVPQDASQPKRQSVLPMPPYRSVQPVRLQSYSLSQIRSTTH
jgi:hypothetical protein